MLRRIILFIFAISLCGCGVVAAPQPRQSDWPFGVTNSVQYELINPDEATAVPNQNDSPQIVVSIIRGEHVNRLLFTSDNDAPAYGRIWFQKNLTDNRIGFALVFDEASIKTGQITLSKDEAIYGLLENDTGPSVDNLQEIVLIFSQCESAIKNAESREPPAKVRKTCNFARADDAWGYVFNQANKHSILSLDLRRQ